MKKITVQDVVAELTKSIELPESTVDGLVAGHNGMEVKKIITTFVASQEVIYRAIQTQANLIITHEGLFYSHAQMLNHFEADLVFQEKKKVIAEANLSIYRFHDGPHKHRPDKITAGLVKALGWEKCIIEQNNASTIVSIPSMTVKEAARHVKEKLAAPFVRVAGDAAMTCSRIGLLAGYRGGGQNVIPLIEAKKLDLVIAGEGPEWEVPEYVRDAVYQKRKMAFMLVGHSQSEEPGMKEIAALLKGAFPSVPVEFVSSRPLFQLI